MGVAGNFTKSPGKSIEIVVKNAGDPEKFGVGAERLITFNNIRIVAFLKAMPIHERLESIDPPNLSPVQIGVAPLIV